MENNVTGQSSETEGRARFSRRGFVEGMALTALGLASATSISLVGCSSEAAHGSALYEKGTYASKQKTPYATVEITCTFDEASLTKVSYQVLSSSEMDYFPVYASAIDDYCAAIVENGKTSEVDAVTGATFCSSAINDGVDACMLQALGMADAAAAQEPNPQNDGFDTFEGDCEEVFSPIKLGTMELPNRIIKSAGSSPWADSNNDKITVSTELYGSMAENGVPLIILAGGALSNTGILPESLDKIKGTVDEALGLVSPLVEAVHNADSKIGFQMCFGGAAPTVPDSVINDTPIEELDQFIESVGISAERGKTAGFDCIEIKGASADGLNGFLTRRINKREDEYGPQSIENRTRLFCRMIEKVKEVNGDDFPVGALINGVEENDASLGDDAQFISNEEAKEIAKALVAAGADWIQVRVGAKAQEMNIWAPDVQHIAPKADGLTGFGTTFNYSSHFGGLVDGSRSGFASFLPLVAAIKEAVDVPVGCAACMDLRMGPDYLNEALKQGQIDLAFMNRPLNCDPGLVKKMQEGRREDVRPCMKCMHCHDSIGTNRAVPSSCRMNASSFNSLTETMPEGMTPSPVATKRNIMVIGAGPAGMEAARVAAERGHSVTIYDSETKLGGLLHFARGVKGNHERFDDYIAYITAQLESNGVDVQLSKKVDAAFVKEQAPDAVVVAVGGARESRFSGANVFSPKEAFSPTALGERVVVLGASVQAVDFTAFLLAQGKTVTIVNPNGVEAVDKGQSGWFRTYMLPYLYAEGVKIWNESVVESVDDAGVTITTDAGLEKTIPCDSVVEFHDMIPNLSLADELEAAGIEVHAVGDCAEPYNIQKAVLAGNLCARAL